MTTKITKAQRERLNKRKQTWRVGIVEYLENNGPATALEVYNATRPDRLEISDQKKIHNMASQLTYLTDDGYLTIKDAGKIILIADPEDNVYKGAEKYL